jgi:glycerate kinase
MVTVDPYGRELGASFATNGARAWVEMAMCSGLGISDSRRPLEADSAGTGRMIREASASAGITRTVVAVGGSASTDGGTGAARACGWLFLDARGRELPPGGGALEGLARIERDVGLVGDVLGACDVDSPLLGESGTARVFAPQKGATPEEVLKLERGLANLAERIDADLGLDVGELPHGGAGGGMGAGLRAFFNADLSYGFDVIAEAVDLEAVLPACDVVITGEGSFDGQSSRGKVASRVADVAARFEVPCLLIAGEITVDPGPAFADWIDVSSLFGRERSIYEAEAAVAKAAMKAISSFL